MINRLVTGQPPPRNLAVMEGSSEQILAAASPFEVLSPIDQTIPLVFSSPHSGADYSAEFIASSRLDPLALRRSEDSFVDEIFAAVTDLGAPLLRAHFPRAFLDPNREPYELDPQMFEDELPRFVNSRSPRVQVGLGTIARIVASGEDIYSRKLRFEEATARIDGLYRPYHDALEGLIEATRRRFGCYLLIDCHSMPSIQGQRERGRKMRTDIVLGDCHGTACDPVVTETAQKILSDKGYVVARNAPYAGGFTTAHYGKPYRGGHGLQIEINRSLYMDERTMGRKPYLRQLAADMVDLTKALAGIDLAQLSP